MILTCLKKTCSISANFVRIIRRGCNPVTALFLLLSFSGISLPVHAQTGEVTRLMKGFILVDTDSGLGSRGDTLLVERLTDTGLQTVGYARIVAFRNGMTAARIFEEPEGYYVRVGDAVRRKSSYTGAGRLTVSGPRTARKSTVDSMMTRQTANLPVASGSVSRIPARQAVFGLSWGMSPSQVLAKGASLARVDRRGNLTIYSSSHMPVDLSDAESYQLLFDDQLGLVKVGMITRDIRSDPYGVQGRARFDAIASILKSRYEEKLEYSVAETRAVKPEDFYPCLTDKSCGTWHKIFAAPNKIFLLMLHGLGKDSGYIELVVESVPDFNRAMDRFESLTSHGSDLSPR
jgi:hypothetical protein